MNTSHGRIADEIRQDRGFDSIQQEALLTLMRSADEVRSQLNHYLLDNSDLTYQQYNVLRILRGAGKDGLPTLQIAERMVEHTPGITRLIDRLISKELVKRVRCPHDRRQVLCFITPKALTLLKPLDPALNDFEQRSLTGLSERQMSTLIKTLDQIRSNF